MIAAQIVSAADATSAAACRVVSQNTGILIIRAKLRSREAQVGTRLS
jgi:hypothetical protein